MTRSFLILNLCYNKPGSLIMSLNVYELLYPCALFQLKTHFSNKFGCIEPSEETALIPSHIVVICMSSDHLWLFQSSYWVSDWPNFNTLTMTGGIHSEHTVQFRSIFWSHVMEGTWHAKIWAVSWCHEGTFHQDRKCDKPHCGIFGLIWAFHL